MKDLTRLRTSFSAGNFEPPGARFSIPSFDFEPIRSEAEMGTAPTDPRESVGAATASRLVNLYDVDVRAVAAAI
jgi:hypothetical protein